MAEGHFVTIATELSKKYLKYAVLQVSRIMYNDGVRLGMYDELDHTAAPFNLALRGYDFYRGYYAGRAMIARMRSKQHG